MIDYQSRYSPSVQRTFFWLSLALLAVWSGTGLWAQLQPPCRPVMCVSPVEIEVGWQAGEASFLITNCECDTTFNWSISEGCPWVTVEPETGTLEPKESALIAVNYEYNMDCGDRTCDITVTAPEAIIGGSMAVKLKQGGNTDPDVCVSPLVLNVGPGAGVAAIELWNWSCVKLNWGGHASCPWVTNISPPSGELEKDKRVVVFARYSANSSCESRTCEISFGVGGANAVINQSGSLVSGLDVEPTGLSAPPDIGSIGFTVTNTGCIPINWSSSHSCPWVLLSPPSGTLNAGQSVDVTALYDANPECKKRQCEIAISSPEAGDSAQTFTISQAQGGSAKLSVSPTELSVGGEGGWTSFTVTNSACSVMSWRAIKDCSWVTSLGPGVGELAPEENTSVSVLFGSNPTTSSRTCEIRVNSSTTGETQSVLLTQQPLGSAATLLVEPTGRTIGPAAGAFTFNVSNTGTGSLAWSAAAPCSWITSIFPSGGTLTTGQSTTVTVNNSANSSTDLRTCVITVDAPGVAGGAQTLTVNQTGSAGNPALSVSPGRRLTGSGQTSASFTITNSGGGAMNWSASSSCAWASAIAPSSGTLDAGKSATISIACEANTGPVSRNCTVQISAPGAGGSPKSVTISQSGDATPALEISPSALSAETKAGFATFNIINNGGGTMNWSGAAACGWVSGLSPSSGTLESGQGMSVFVNYESNETGPGRNCIINVDAPGAVGSPKSLTISQAGNEVPDLSVAPNALQAEQAAGTRQFTVTNSGFGTMEWTAAADCNWITQLEPAAGSLAASESATVTMTYVANGAADERNCTVTVTAPDATNTTASLTLTQAGTAPAQPACGCPFESFKGDWQSFFQKYLGDLLVLSVSIVLALGLSRFRRD